MIQLSDHFNYKRLLRFTLPSIIMLVFTSIYGVVDGFFVSNFVGKTPFAAVNFIMPFLMILGCAGFMFGTGGGALIAITMGTGNGEWQKSKRIIFTRCIYIICMWHCPCFIWLSLSTPCSLFHGRRRPAFGGLRYLRQGYFAGHPFLCAAIRIPVPVFHRRKTQLRPWYNYSCRTHKYYF